MSFKLFPIKKISPSIPRIMIKTKKAKLSLTCSGEKTEQTNLIKPVIANSTVKPILKPSAILLT